MAPKTYKKKTYKKYRTSYLYKRPSNKYLRISLDFMGTIIKGPTAFVWSGLEQTPNKWYISNMLLGSVTWQNYSKIFELCRLRSAAITVTPSSTCNNTENTAFYVNLCYYAVDPSSLSLATAVESPNCMTLSPLQKSYKYINLLGNTGSWIGLNPNNYEHNGVLIITSNINSQTSSTLAWTVKVTLYYTLKLPSV